MAKVEKGKLVLSDEEIALIEEGKEFDLIPNQTGVYLLIDKDLEKGKEGTQICIEVPDRMRDAKEIVVGKIRKANLSDVVEGKFESSLSGAEAEALKELLKEGRVILFKLNESYKKGVYKINPDFGGESGGEEKGKKAKKYESENPDAAEKPFDKYYLKTDGIMVVKSQNLVRKISEEREKEIKEGNLRGLKSFDGNYYIIENELLERHLGKALEEFRKKESQGLGELAKNAGVSKMLAKVVCEFLKDEGEIIERRKGEYSFIS